MDEVGEGTVSVSPRKVKTKFFKFQICNLCIFLYGLKERFRKKANDEETGLGWDGENSNFENVFFG